MSGELNRMRILRYALAAGLLGFLPAISADEATAVKVGLARPSWSNLPGVDGRAHSLASLADKKTVVIAITCNHCPIALEYFQRLNDFAKSHCPPHGDVALVAISVSNLETDKLDRMKELADREMLCFPYLHDSSQSIGKELGATVTPQFFVLDQDRKLVYRGPWDDQVNRAKVKVRYVEDAVRALQEGKSPPIAEVRSIGCRIQFDR
jgi:thiol-disulfide isomerase/thioredoxin